MSLHFTRIALFSALTLAAAPAVVAAAPATPSASVEHVAAPIAAPVQGDGSSYAAREARDKSVANYEGGNVVVIGISGGALLLIVILLILL